MPGAIEFIFDNHVNPPVPQRYKARDIFYYIDKGVVRVSRVSRVERGYLNSVKVKYGYLYFGENGMCYYHVGIDRANMFDTFNDAEDEVHKRVKESVSMKNFVAHVDSIMQEMERVK